MALKLITAPATYPVSLDEAKRHLKVDFDDDDALIDAAIIAASRNAEQFVGRAFIDQTWDLYLDEFPCVGIYRPFGLFRYSSWRSHRSHHLEIEIPMPPLIEVEGVFYKDGAGDEQPVDAVGYTVDAVTEPGRVVPISAWPIAKQIPNAVRIRFRAGFVDLDESPVADVPGPIKAAVLLYIGDLYANRETMLTGERAAAVQLPWAAEQLLRPYRVHTAMA